jgi:hypothetical protein
MLTHIILISRYTDGKRYSSGSGGGNLHALQVTTPPGDSWLTQIKHGVHREAWVEYENQLESRLKQDPKYKGNLPAGLTQTVPAPMVSYNPSSVMVQQTKHSSYLAAASTTNVMDTLNQGGLSAEQLYAKLKAEIRAELITEYHELNAPIYAGLEAQQNSIDVLNANTKDLQVQQGKATEQTAQNAAKLEEITMNLKTAQSETTALATEMERMRTTTMTFADFQALQDIKDAKAAAERQKEREREREERKQDMANLLQQHTNFSLQPIARTVLTLKRSHTTPTESDEDNELKADDHDGEDAMDQDRDDDHE